MDRRVKVALLVQALYSFPIRLLEPYNTLFAQSLGATGTDIGVINSVSAAAQGAFSLPLGLVIEGSSVKKIILLGLLCDIAAMIIFISAQVWYMLVPAFILYFRLIRQLLIADIMFVSLSQTRLRSTVIGLARFFSGISSLLAPVIATMFVTYFGGINAPSIRTLYVFAFAIFLSLFFIVWYYLGEYTLNSSQRKTTSLIQGYADFLAKTKYIKRWTLMMFFRYGGLYLLTIFTSLWIVNVKGGTPAILGTVITLSTFVAMVAQFPAGRLADKFGRKRAFAFFDIFYCLGIFVLICGPNFEWLLLAAILGIGLNGIGGASFTPFITMWWETVPAENRGKLYGLDGAIAGLSGMLMSIVGGILWDQGFKAFTLLIPALLELLFIMPLTYTIAETRSNT